MNEIEKKKKNRKEEKNIAKKKLKGNRTVLIAQFSFSSNFCAPSKIIKIKFSINAVFNMTYLILVPKHHLSPYNPLSFVLSHISLN